MPPSSLPCDEKGRVGDHLGPDPHMALLDVLCRRRHRLTHLESGHDDGQPPAADCRYAELVLQVAECGCGVEEAHPVQLLQQLLLVPSAKRVLRVKTRQTVRKVLQVPAELVVLAVVLALLKVVAPHDGHIAVLLVGPPLDQGDLLEQLLLMVF